MKSIGIVGAGISGATTAWYLSRLLPEARVELFEAAEQVGGVIQTRNEPYLIEYGADNFATLIPDALQMVRDMGLESEFITPQRDFRIAQVVHRGRLAPIPNGFSLMQPTQLRSVLSTPILSTWGKLRVLAEYFVPPRNDSEDESVASFATRRLGRECYERLVEPIVGGIFTARAESLSMQAAMPQFVAMEQEHGGLIRAARAKRRESNPESRAARGASGARYDQFIAPKQGMSWWLEQIVAPKYDSLHLRTRVKSISRTTEGRWELISVSLKTEEVRSWQFDEIVLAVPSYVAAELVGGVAADLGQDLAAIPYASSAIAVLAVPKCEIRPESFCFGSIAPSIENRSALAVSLSSEKYAGRCPADVVLARVFMGGAVRPDLMEQSDSALLEMARREIADLFGPKSPPRYEELIRWERAMPQYLVGHLQRIRRIRDRVAKFPGLELVGNAYDGVGVPQCVRGAKAAAYRIADRYWTAPSET